MSAHLVAMVALAVTVCGCGSDPSPVGTVTGQVAVFGGNLVDPAPSPMQAATVQVLGANSVSVITDANGRYAVRLRPGRYTLHVVDRPACQDAAATITAGAVTHANIQCIIF